LLLHILVWAAQAGAKRVYAIEYTDMAKHARRVVKANNVDHIVTVIQGAVEDVILPQEDWDGINNKNNNNHSNNNNHDSNIECGLGGLTLEEGDVEVNVNGKKNQRVVDIILSG
jgi:homoserine trans-succinylase